MPTINIEQGKRKRTCHHCSCGIPNTEYHVRILKDGHWVVNLCWKCVRALNGFLQNIVEGGEA
jgi:hypothetical protein